jgi:hypothetical protein
MVNTISVCLEVGPAGTGVFVLRNVFKMLDYTRKIVVNYLRSFPRDKKHGIFQPKKDPSPICNLWTAKKVLRRLVDHERLHTKYIDKVLQICTKKKCAMLRQNKSKGLLRGVKEYR